MFSFAQPPRERTLGDLPRPSTPRLFTVLDLRPDGPPVEGAAFAVAALLSHVTHMTVHKKDLELSKPAVKDAARRLEDAARKAKLPLDAAMDELQRRLRAHEGHGDAAPAPAAGPDLSVLEPTVYERVLAYVGLAWLATYLLSVFSSRRRHAARRKRNAAEAIYRGDWHRRPIGANEIGFLVLPLLRLSDRLNRDLGLGPEEPAWLAPGRAPWMLQWMVLTLRQWHVRFALRFLAGRALIGWIVLILALAEAWKALAKGPLGEGLGAVGSSEVPQYTAPGVQLAAGGSGHVTLHGHQLQGSVQGAWE